jgi:hypothetical protein
MIFLLVSSTSCQAKKLFKLPASVTGGFKRGSGEGIFACFRFLNSRKKKPGSSAFTVLLIFTIYKTKSIMKRIIFLSLVLCVLFSCKESVKTDDTTAKTDDATSKGSDAKALYEKNLASLKNGIAAFENEKMGDWAASVADSAIWNSPGYGAAPAKKEDWKKALTAYTTDWDSIKLKNPNFLPGIDSATHEFDGSVRYYGEWDAVHKSGVRTSVNFYGSYEFNKDGKVVNASEFFDLGGLMNAVKGKEK